jgi:trimeric autotransporter adhesin
MRVAGFLLGIILIAATAVADDPSPRGEWVSWSHMAGADAWVGAIADFGDLVVVGGAFAHIGPIAGSVAAWNRATGEWTGFAGGPGGQVFALVVHDGELHAGGWISYVGPFVKRWKGDHWEALGAVDGHDQVSSLVTFGGDLYAVTVGSALRRWNGAEWETVLEIGGSVSRCLVHDGLLLLAGSFTTAGGLPVSNLVAWDGDGPVVAYQGLGAVVYDLGLWSGALVAAMANAGVWRWDGAAWQSMGPFDPQWNTYPRLAARDNQLFLLKRHAYWEGPSGHYIYRWTGNDWEQFGTDVWAASVNQLHLDEQGGLWIGGDFAGFGPVAGRNIQYHDGADWVTLFPDALGCDGIVHDLVVHDGKLVAGGDFFAAGPVWSPLAAAWDGSTWSERGDWNDTFEILDLNSSLQTVGTFGPWLLSSGEDPGLLLEFCAAWSPAAAWQVYDYRVAVAFASWNGWLIEGLYSSVQRRSSPGGPSTTLAAIDGYLRNLAVWQDQLVAVGDFISVNGQAIADVAIYDGSTWRGAGQGTSRWIVAATEFAGDLVVGGRFPSIDGVPAANVARWDGEAWWPLGAGLNGIVSDLTAYEDMLVVVGDFTEAGGQPAANVALWDGDAWWPLDGGTDDVVEAVCVYDGDLYLGGSFRNAGGVPSSHIARWHRYDVTAAGFGTPRAATAITAVAPNPANPRVEISYSLAQAGPVALDIHDLRGRTVRRLLDGAQAGGSHTVVWDGRDDRGAAAASGVYLVRLRAGGREDVRKVVVAR